ncbi:MAG: ribbon-helix-helix protein, CopG family [Rhizobiales bacterium]|nr:ribbon-helix-helix protein, CopG family [Hyphomicrobiales bacterium]
MNAFTIRLPDETADKLDRIAEKMDRSRAYVAAQAIEDFIAREEWQLAEIQTGLAEAVRGEFANDGEVERVFNKYSAPGRSK